ncbi:Multidrug resistance protein [Sulfobacillus acidophilus TPY]|uniref:Major facilitator superfamily MFS_1 n=1 Tax=Sulfobacillus acidophilus (strain ATCC 700253 / DSM 10332 / NAL) TaxID=679936 RepID=G8TSU0_SULAD|nr:Multidrug resistance protein [Sulfobacillus acidophilus TPY]AEW04467.1 major facilitator superfamily MFS_1 [Sulfobacillus acidophilus DSM 10332]
MGFLSHRSTLSFLFLGIMFFVGVDLNLIAPLIPAIDTSFRISPAKGGFLVTAFALGYIFASPLAGWAADRWGRRQVVLTGLTGLFLAELASALAPDFFALLAARTAGGLFAGAVSPEIYAWIGDQYHGEARTRSMALASFGLSLSTVLGVPLGMGIGQIAGWRVALGLLAGFFAVSETLLLHVKAPVPPRSARVPPPWSPSRQWRPLWISFCAFGAVGAIYTFLPTELTRYGLGPQALLAVLMGYGGLSALGNLIYARKAIHGGILPVLRRALWSETVIILILTVIALKVSLPGLILSSLGFGFIQAYIPLIKSWASQVPSRMRARSLAWNNTAMYSGLLSGSAAASLVYRHGQFWPIATIGLGFILLATVGLPALRKNGTFFQ